MCFSITKRSAVYCVTTQIRHLLKISHLLNNTKFADDYVITVKTL